MGAALRLLITLLLGVVVGATAISVYVSNDQPRRGIGPITIPATQAQPLRLPPPAIETANLAPPASRENRQPSDAVIDVYERVSPAVVNINFTASARDLFGRPVTQEGTGSGFIIDRDGHIVTNHHVTAGATRLDITLANGDSYVGEVVGFDRANDLAVVRLQAPPEVLAGLTVASLGDSDQLRVGETVVAIGNPFGLERSASVGIVSSLGRTRPGESQRAIANMIQTDAAINPGNSGGPLLNLNGEVIGINEQIQSPGGVGGNVGIGFAVPVNALKRYLPDLLAGREPEHAWLGISGDRLTPTLAETFELPIKQGVIVVGVVPNGPAARSGLRGSSNLANADIITEIDGRRMRSVEDLIRYVDSRNPGDTVRVTLLRGGRTQSVDVVLGVWPTNVPLG